MNDASQKICVVVTCFAEDQPGYLDFSYRIKSLAKHYQLTILSQDELTHPELMVPSARYRALGRQSGKYGWLSYLWKCATYIRKHKPDVLVLLHSSAAPISLLVGGIPVCLYWNEHPGNLAHMPEGFSPLRYALTKVLHQTVFLGARHAELVMPIGEDLRDDLLSNGCRQDRVKLIYMGVADDFSGCAVNREAVGNNKSLELIYIGTVSAPRGRDVMLEGMAEVARAGDDVHLTIVGAGDAQLTYCRDRLSELGIQDHVRVSGRIPGSGIPALLAKADLGICLWEDKPWWRLNPPTKLFEYLVAGLPVLASDICTHTRYIGSWRNGLIFEYNAKDFARAVGELAASQGELPGMKRNALQSGQQYRWSRIEPVFLGHVAGLVKA